MRSLFLFLVILINSTFLFGTHSVDIGVTEINSLSQIPDAQPEGTVYLFDIDDTLFDSPYMLGSKTWRKHIRDATRKDLTQNWHDVFSLFFARHHPLETVESQTSQFILDLQAKGHGVFGFTRRERQLWYDTPVDDVDQLTVSQLRALGIHFNKSNYASLVDVPEYFEGTFFVNTDPKGEYVLQWLANTPVQPKKVIFIDDKLSQVESVAEALSQLGIDHACYWYTPTDAKVRQFDPLIANIQLYHFWMSGGTEIVSDEEARGIAQDHPDKTAEHYLKQVLEGIN